jgi:molybdate transport system substrate-binding protein
MMHFPKRSRLHAILAALTLFGAATLGVNAQAQQLTVSAAASLTDAFKELSPAFEASQPGVTLRLNFAASGTLLQQIKQGAPVDVFASADQTTMNRAQEQNLIASESRRDFARNSLVLIEPGQQALGLKTLQDLQQTEVRRIAVGQAATVPAGRYTQQSLEAAGLWQGLTAKFVLADSVRQVLDYVSRGEAEAGFVYRTDALAAGNKVRIVLSATGHDPVSYPVARTAEAPQPKLAQAFLDFLQTDQAQAVLQRHGFTHP